MTEFTTTEIDRIRKILIGVRIGNTERLDLKKADVELLAKRVEELDDGTLMIGEFAPWALRRMKEELRANKAWLQECVESARIAELITLETQHMVNALQALVDGGLYVSGDEVNERWGNVEADYIERGLYPETEPEAAPPEAVVEVAKVAPPPPPVAPTIAQPKPAPPVVKPPVDDLSPRILAALDGLIAAHGQELNAMRVSEHLGAAHEKVRVALGLLERDGHIQLAKHPSRNMYAILRPGEKLDAPDMSENQSKLLAALVSLAGEDWTASVSRGRLSQMTEIKSGSLDQILYALERKDRIRVLDRGNSTTPTKFMICEGARPSRPAPPKTDAELIAEALAAGKVTQCPPAHVH